MSHASRGDARPRNRQRRRLAVGASALLASIGAFASFTLGPASAGTHSRDWSAANRLLAVNRRNGVLANDSGGALQMISHTDPSHGSLTLNNDGSFEYVPQQGFVGDDTFSYTIANGVQLFSDNLPPLGTFGGVSLNAGAFGSSMYPAPGRPGFFYGLEDRGPQQAGITPVTSTLFLDVDALLTSLDPQDRFYSHDKVEGVAVLNGGHQIMISNDSDFGIAGVTNAAPPWQLQSKISPATGQQDNGEYLVIDMDRIAQSTSTAATSTASVTTHVTQG